MIPLKDGAILAALPGPLDSARRGRLNDAQRASVGQATGSPITGPATGRRQK